MVSNVLISAAVRRLREQVLTQNPVLYLVMPLGYVLGIAGTYLVGDRSASALFSGINTESYARLLGLSLGVIGLTSGAVVGLVTPALSDLDAQIVATSVSRRRVLFVVSVVPLLALTVLMAPLLIAFVLGASASAGVSVATRFLLLQVASAVLGLVLAAVIRASIQLKWRSVALSVAALMLAWAGLGAISPGKAALGPLDLLQSARPDVVAQVAQLALVLAILAVLVVVWFTTLATVVDEKRAASLRFILIAIPRKVLPAIVVSELKIFGRNSMLRRNGLAVIVASPLMAVLFVLVSPDAAEGAFALAALVAISGSAAYGLSAAALLSDQRWLLAQLRDRGPMKKAMTTAAGVQIVVSSVALLGAGTVTSTITWNSAVLALVLQATGVAIIVGTLLPWADSASRQAACYLLFLVGFGSIYWLFTRLSIGVNTMGVPGAPVLVLLSAVLCAVSVLFGARRILGNSNAR